MCGLIFRKHDYYISLALTDKGWVLYKNSGKVRFKNWAEGCAAAYEMGMVLHIVVYVKSHFPLSTPENWTEIERIMYEFSKSYSEIPSKYNLFQVI